MRKNIVILGLSLFGTVINATSLHSTASSTQTAWEDWTTNTGSSTTASSTQAAWENWTTHTGSSNTSTKYAPACLAKGAKSISGSTGSARSTQSAAKSADVSTAKSGIAGNSGAASTATETLTIGSKGTGVLIVISESGSKSASEAFYTGVPIVGTAELPAVISEIVFPTSSPKYTFKVAGQALGVNKLSQNKTNGLSNLGKLDAPTYPKFLGGTANSTSGFPWGNRTAGNTNPYKNPPKTGTTRTYDFTIARATLAPDGVEREMLLINGQFPGPTIEANWGDTIQVTVTNAITSPEEGTAIHWHGLLQTDTNYEDGVPGITQCPIAPGTTFTYTFNADLYGTSWYHSHYSAQYAGGAIGAMIIHGPSQVDYDEDLGPVMVSDYFHNDYNVMVEKAMSVNLVATSLDSDNNLINGKGDYNCSLVTDNTTCTSNAGLAKFQFQSGSSYRLRLINTGAEAIQKFSIDNHVMNVIAYDFVPIEPYETEIVTLGVGQRADVIVTANGSSTDLVWMRSTITSCSLTNQPDAYAIIYYEYANTTAEPTTTAWTDSTNGCANDALSSTVPYYSIAPGTPETTIDIDLSFTINSTGYFLWTMDGSSFRVDYNSPLLEMVQSGNTTFESDWNVYDFGSNTSFRIVINNEAPVAHPMHVHGHNMYILNEGTGSWDGSTIINANNTMRRDVQLLQPNGYLVMQLDADNPGVWPFHCHIAWHVSQGLYVNILERPSDILNMTIPSTVSDLCTSWDAFTNVDVVDQIDSGLRRKRDMRRAIRRSW